MLSQREGAQTEGSNEPLDHEYNLYWFVLELVLRKGSSGFSAENRERQNLSILMRKSS